MSAFLRLSSLVLVSGLVSGLAACSESGFSYVRDYGGVYESTLSGRACNPDSGRWLEGAVVYTHIVNDAGDLIDTAETYTDVDGRWSLTELRGDQAYTIFVQYGNEIVDMYDVEVPNNAEIEVPSPACGADLGRVAVVTGHYDDWETVLPDIGVTNYELIDGMTEEDLGQFLSDVGNLSDFSAIFFAGGHVEAGVIYDVDGSDAARVEAVRAAIREYVSSGGVVYASDWSYDVVELCWPDRIEFLGDDTDPGAAQLGEPDTIRANVLDADLASSLGGDRAELSFDLDTWPVVESVDENVTVFHQADSIPYRDGTEQYTLNDSPLLMMFKPDAGKVVFSSWRVAANTTGRPAQSLSYVLGL